MSRLAAILFAVLIGLCSLGCTKPLYTVIPPLECPPAVKPILPQLNDDYLDTIENGKILAQRDDYLRQYIKSLEDTISCYEQQTGVDE